MAILVSWTSLSLHCLPLRYALDELTAALHHISSSLNDVLKRVQCIKGEIKDMIATTETRPAQPRTKVPLIVRVRKLAT